MWWFYTRVDFDYRDWTKPNAKYLMKAMSNVRYKYAVKVLPHDWDRHQAHQIDTNDEVIRARERIDPTKYE
jgi:hypothetical protein